MNEIKNLPVSLIQAAQLVLDEGAELTIDEEEVIEDAISKMNVPTEDEPQEELSGEKEEVIINPEYKTFRSRLPY